MRKIVMGIAATAFLVAGASLAQAQINPFGKWAQPGLTKEESTLVSNAAKSVYEKPDVKVGDRADWKSDKTGNSGWVEAMRLFKYKEYNCVELLYGFNIKDAEQARNTITLNRCKGPDGTWKVL